MKHYIIKKDVIRFYSWGNFIAMKHLLTLLKQEILYKRVILANVISQSLAFVYKWVFLQKLFDYQHLAMYNSLKVLNGCWSSKTIYWPFKSSYFSFWSLFRQPPHQLCLMGIWFSYWSFDNTTDSPQLRNKPKCMLRAYA